MRVAIPRRTVAVLVGAGVLAACSTEKGPVDPPALNEVPVITSMSADFGEWSAPTNLGSVVNSPAADNSPEMSRDGLSLYFGSTRPGGFGSTDIYVSRRACTDMSDERCAWGIPVNLGESINTAAIDGGPHLSRDGHWLYLISDRPGGFGSNDIWVSYREHVHDDLAWGIPVNIGAPINTSGLEAGPNLRGNDFYFHRGPAVGNTDIYLSHIVDGGFTEPVRIDEVSSLAEEGQPFFDQRPSTRWDGREMILSSDRPGTHGLQDIWVSTRSSNAAPWTMPRNLGPLINTPSQEQTPTISDDGTILLFASNRGGNTDLYMATRSRLPR